MPRVDIVKIERFRKRRWRQKLLRAARKYGKRRQKPSTVAPIPLGGVLSSILEFLRKTVRGKDVITFNAQERRYELMIPEAFSLIDNYDDALNVIFSLIKLSADPYACRIYIDHSKCTHMELAASALLDVIVMEIRNEWRNTRHNVSIQGRVPKTGRVLELLKCTGLLKHLRIKGMEATPEMEKKYLHFELLKGRKQKGTMRAASDQEEFADAIAEHIDRCFQSGAKMALTLETKKKIHNWVGEIIANAEDHSGADEWFTISYATAIEREGADAAGTIYECQMAVFGFGRSYFQSLSQPSTPTEIRHLIEGLTEHHASKGIFGWNDKFKKEDLWTLYALQDGVTRKTEPGRGSGTVKMIEAFQTIGRT
jgi:hypothetical protein